MPCLTIRPRFSNDRSPYVSPTSRLFLLSLHTSTQSTADFFLTARPLVHKQEAANHREEEMSQALAREASRHRRATEALAAAVWVDLGGLRSAVDLLVDALVGEKEDSGAGEGDSPCLPLNLVPEVVVVFYL